MERWTWLSGRPFGRLGVTGAFALAALFIILIAAWLLDWRGASPEERELVEYVQTAGVPPVEAVIRASSGNRIVLLSDIHSSAGPKRLAAQAIERMSGLDALVVEVGADQQPFLDRYFEQTPEDASILMSHPRTLREPGGAARAYLDLYRTIWRVNSELGPDQRIRVLAADLPGWPPAAAPSPAEAARKLAERTEYMARRIQSEILLNNPSARMIVLINGVQAFKSGAGELQTGGTARVTVDWLAKRLRQDSPEEVYSFLIDAPATGLSGSETLPYAGTRIAEILRASGVGRSLAVRINGHFDFLRRPIVQKGSPGLGFEIVPRDYTLQDVADAYIYLRN